MIMAHWREATSANAAQHQGVARTSRPKPNSNMGATTPARGSRQICACCARYRPPLVRGAPRQHRAARSSGRTAGEWRGAVRRAAPRVPGPPQLPSGRDAPTAWKQCTRGAPHRGRALCICRTSIAFPRSRRRRRRRGGRQRPCLALYGLLSAEAV